MKSRLLGAFGTVFLFTTQIIAQIYPDTLWVPVTYYDFRSDVSNPEFQCDPYNTGVWHNMIQDTLDKDRKPIASPINSRIQRNAYVKYWYRDWNSTIRGKDFTRPVYSGANYTGTIQTVSHDTSFKNIVIQDSLPFRYITGSVGVYQYVNSTFFPLDSRGFGKEGRSRNYSFSMELHWTFTKQPGLVFRFTGDDDVWAFIDNRLQMDIGGIHSASSDSFFVDDIPGLENGKEYSFDFFFAERHTASSSIRITTNIISIPPTTLNLHAEPDGDICAGDTLRLFATVLDDTGGVRPEIGERTTWRFIRSGGNASSTIFPHAGDTVRFSPTEAWDTVAIEGTVQEGAVILRDTLKVYVRACHPHHLVIEAAPPPYTGSALRNDNPLTELRIASNQPSASAYAVIRDKFGNFIEASQVTTWSITQGAGTIIDRVANGAQASGEGVVYKEGPSGRGEVAAQSQKYTGTLFRDLVPVVVDVVNYNNLRIVVNSHGTFVRISSLLMNTEACSLLIVQGERSDGLGWESVPGNWSMSSNLRSSTNPPTSSQTWNFCPTDTASAGTITAAFGGKSVQITVQVIPGGPYSLNLYPSASATVPYVQPPAYIDSIVAGTSVPIYARIFDVNGVVLTQYNSVTAPVVWSIKEVSGYPPYPTGTLQGPGGNQNSLRATRAPNVVQVKATFNQNGRIFSDSVQFRVIHTVPHHITIQTDTATILNWADVTQIEFGPSDTSRLLYPVIRDQYNNYIMRAELSQWSSRDTAVATAEATDRVFEGEGIVIRKGDSTNVTLIDATCYGFKDSVRVALTAIKYDSLQVYIIDNGTRQIDTIRIRTDENQMLYARGKRSDGRGWDDIPVTWNISTGLTVKGNPPGYSQNWNVTPSSIDTGKIFITRGGSISDTIVALFLPGLPGTIALYKGPGNPAGVQHYSLPPVFDTMTAGSTYPIVAKIFDRNSLWLSQYENNTTSVPLISWQINRITGSVNGDTLNRKTGALVSFSPKKAYMTYQITATFVEGTRQATASVNVFVKPGPVHHLVIEASANPSGTSLNFDSPFPNGVEFKRTDTIQYAYAVLRDTHQNFIGTSQSTNWQSLSEQLFIATEATAVFGQGRIRRIGELGETQVLAWNRNNPTLRDTVTVRATDFSYDSLRIVVDDSVRIEYLEMRSDQDTTVMVLGLRSFDQQWVPVVGNWTYQSTNISFSQNSQHSLIFAPGDTTMGFLIVKGGALTIPDTVRVVVNPGLADMLVLYSRRGPVSANNVPYPPVNDSIPVIAGQYFPLVSKIFDRNEVWLKQYESGAASNQIKWTILELSGNDSSGFLSGISGDSVAFFPLRAYRGVYIISSLIVNNNTLSDTVLLSIRPGKPFRMFLEGSPNVNTTTPNPIDTINILSNMTSSFAYAILRDSLGNFASYSTVTTWGVVNNDSSVSVRNGTTAIGEGVIVRNDSQAVVTIYAVDAGGFQDSTVIKLVKYYYKELRILVDYDPDRDSLVMLTTEDTTLRVQGLRSDTTLWEYADNAIWEYSPSLRMTPVTQSGRIWRFSPTDTGTGSIRVTLRMDSITKPDTLKVRFIPGPPSEIRIRIITPEQQRIAGKPIQMVIELYNEDGLIKGSYDFNSVKYEDILPNGGRPRPFVLMSADTLFLDSLGKQHFENGIDTIPLVLFYAPWNNQDSLHRITITMDKLTASTERFRLYPSDLNKLVLEKDARWVSPIGDTLIIRTTDQPIQITSVGYDEFGNRRGAEYSNWNADSTLHDIPGIKNNVTSIYYDGITVKNNEAGRITAVPSDTTGENLSTSVFVKVVAPPVKLKSATTGDFDGDGYLDHIILKFDRPATLPKGYPFDMKISYKDIIFYVDEDSIMLDSSRTDSIWVIAIPEETHNTTLQTAWKPIINFDKNDNLGLDSILNHICLDGAGPVIASVTKERVTNNRKDDVITVVFSEPMQRFDNIPLPVTEKPISILYVWEKDSTGNFKLLDSILTGIESLIENDSKDQTSIKFRTTNGVNLTQAHYFSIKTFITAGGDTTALITDIISSGDPNTTNTPAVNNRQVRIVVIGAPAPDMIMFPNPATASEGLVPAGEIYIKHDSRAKDFVKNNGGGIVFSTALVVPHKDENVKVKCLFKIYDIAGNLVFSGQNDDITRDIDAGGGEAEIDIYWNGFKKNRMKAAAGVYKAIEYFEYYGSPDANKYKDTRVTGVLGLNQGIK